MNKLSKKSLVMSGMQLFLRLYKIEAIGVDKGNVMGRINMTFSSCILEQGAISSKTQGSVLTTVFERECVLVMADHFRIVEEILEDFLHQLQKGAVEKPPDLQILLTLIHRHLFEPGLSFAFIQEKSGLRNHNISSRFKQHMGFGIGQYIFEHRLEAAKRLLLVEELSIFTISQAIGYEYPESFSRAFKRSIGLNPSQFRTCLKMKC